MQMAQAGMIEIAENAESAGSNVAPFFVATHNGSGKVRMVLDARRVNERFLPLDTTELRTPGAWQGLRKAAGSNLNIAQIDVECAFCLICSPPGLSVLMVLLPIGRAYPVAN